MSYQLFETMLFQDSKIFLLKNHLTRIFYSAMYFGFKTHNLCALK
ncbi:aminotransferase class IV [Helicobacter didelphidarum]|nr:aminotransferase class IV [Helicobacter didelphidarum]